MKDSIDWKAVQKQYPKEWVSPKYAAIILDCSPKTVRGLMDKGEISLLERNPWRKVTLKELKRFADSMGIKDASPKDPREDLRFWLRKGLYKEYGAQYKEEMEEAFLWIYNEPIPKWKNMLEALRLSYEYGIHETKGLQLEKAKELFRFLS